MGAKNKSSDVNNRQPIDTNTAVDNTTTTEPAKDNWLISSLKSDEVPAYTTHDLGAPTLSTDYKLDDSYIKNISNASPNDPNLDYERGENQRGLDQFGNSMVQFLGGVTGGAILTAGLSLDAKEAVGLATDTEKDFSNTLYDLGSKIIQKSAENWPVYEKEPGKVRPLDSGWWANQWAQQGLSGGVGVYTGVEALALGALTDGIAAADVLAEGANVVSKVRDIVKLRNAKAFDTLLSTVSESDKLKNIATKWALFHRYGEAMMESNDTFKQTYQELLDKGVDEKTARTAAAHGATIDFRWNMPLLAMDALMMKTMTFNPVSGAGEGVVEKMLGSIGSKAGRVAAQTGSLILENSSEEFLQQIGQDEGQYTADLESGVVRDKNFTERLSNYLKSPEEWNAAIGGAIGGIVYEGLGHVFSKVHQNQQLNNLKAQHSDYIRNLDGTTKLWSDLVKETDAKNDPVASANVRQSMGVSRALDGLHLDNLLDEDTAFPGYKAYLSGTLDAVNSGSESRLKDLGIDPTDQTTLSHIKQEFPKYIQDADDIKKLYDINKENNSRDAIKPITYRQFSLQKLNELNQSYDNKIQAYKNDIPDYDNLSYTGKQLFDTKYTERALIGIKTELSKELDKQSDEVSRDSLQTALDNIDTKIKTNNELRTKLLDSSQDTRSDAEKSKDSQILKGIERQHDLTQLESTKIAVESKIDRTRKELSIWTDKKFQSKTNQKKLESLLKDANTKEELSKVEQALKSTNSLTPEFKQRIQDKKDFIAVTNQIKSTKEIKDNNKVNVTSVVKEQENTTDNKKVTNLNNTAKEQENTEPTVLFKESELKAAENNKNNTKQEENILRVNNATDLQELSNIEKILNAKNQLSSEIQVAIKSRIIELKTANSKENYTLVGTGSRKNLSIWANEKLQTKEEFDKNIAEYFKETGLLFSNLQKSLSLDPPYSERKELHNKYTEEEQILKNKYDIKRDKYGRDIKSYFDYKNSIDNEGYTDNTKEEAKTDFSPERQDITDDLVGKVTIIDEVPIGFWYDPEIVDRELSDGDKKKFENGIKRYYEDFKRLLGKNPSFGDIVLDMIKRSSIENVKAVFDKLAYGWKANNYTDTNFKRTYENIFGDIAENLNRLTNELTADENSGENNTQEEEQTPALNTDKPVVTNDNGDKIFIKDSTGGYKTNTPDLIFAHLSLGYEEVRVTNPDGTISIKLKSTGTELNRSSEVDNLQLLKPDSMQPGTKLTIKIHPDANNIPITEYNSEWVKEKSTPFGELLARDPSKGIEIPMLIYVDDIPVSFVHNTDWYNVNRVTPGIISQARENLIALRNAVINNGGTLEAVVTNKSLGQSEAIKDANGNTKDKNGKTIIKKLSEVNPQATLGTVNGQQNIITTNGEVKRSQLINTGDSTIVKDGVVVDLREVGVKDGAKIYMAYTVTRHTLQKVDAQTIGRAITLYAFTKDLNHTLLSKETKDRLIKEIESITGINISDPQGINKFLSQYINVGNSGTSGTAESIHEIMEGRTNIPDGTPYANMIKGIITFGVKGNKDSRVTINTFDYGDNQKRNRDKSFVESDRETSMKMIENIKKITAQILPLFPQNTDNKRLKSEKPMISIDDGSKITKTFDTYADHLRDRYSTSINAFNIGTEEDPNYVTFLQPIITFDYDKNQKRTIPVAEKEEKGKENVNQTEETTKENNNTQENQAENEEKKEVNKPNEEKLAENTSEPSSEEVKTFLLNKAVELRKLGISEDAIQMMLGGIKEEKKESDEDFDPTVIERDALFGLTQKRIEKLSSYILNKLSLKLKSYNSKKELNTTSLVRYLNTVISGILPEFGITKFIDENINYKKNLNDINDYINSSQYNIDIDNKIAELQKGRDELYKQLETQYSNRRVIKSFLNNPIIEKYDEDQQQLIKQILPRLFSEDLGRFKSKDQILGYYKNQVRVGKIVNPRSFKYLGKVSQLSKLQTIKDYLSVVGNKSKIIEVIKNEIFRRRKFFTSPLVIEKRNSIEAEKLAQDEIDKQKRIDSNKKEDDKYVNSDVVEKVEGLIGGRELNNVDSIDAALQNAEINPEIAVLKNNGLPLNRVNDENTESILYNDILNLPEVNGNKSIADKVISLIYSDNFKEFFGDWQNDPENSSKVVDKNGQPKIVYHGTGRMFTSFDINRATEVSGLKEEPALYFTDSPSVAFFYSILERQDNLKIIPTIIDNIVSNSATLEKRENAYREFPEIKVLINSLKEKGLSNKEIQEELKSIRKDYQKIQDLSKGGAIGNENSNNREILSGIKQLKENRKKILQGTHKFKGVLEYGISASSGYKRVLIRTNGKIESSFPELSEYNQKNIKDIGVYGLQKIIGVFESAYKANKKDINEKLRAGGFKPKIIASFLSIKDPDIKDYGKKSFVSEVGNKVIQQVRESINNGNDGAIINNIVDPENSNNYAVFKSNQIKSVFNKGDFSAKQDDILFDPSYASDTDEVITEAKKEIKGISDISTPQRRELSRFVARQIESLILPKYGTRLNLNRVKAEANRSFNAILGGTQTKIENSIGELKKLSDTGNYPNLIPVLDELSTKLNDISVVKNNWNVIINDALKDVYKNTGIKEVEVTGAENYAINIDKYNKESETEYNTLWSKLNSETNDNPSPTQIEDLNHWYEIKLADLRDKYDLQENIEGNIETYEEYLAKQDENSANTSNIDDGSEVQTIDEGVDKNHSTTSIEESRKDNASYLVKRLLSSIPEYSSPNSVKIGFLGIPIYPGYSENYTRVKQLLGATRDSKADYDSVISKLKEYSDTIPWVNVLLDKLAKADQQTKNAFVYSMGGDHTMRPRFIMIDSIRAMVLNSRGEYKLQETGKYVLRVFDTNANSILRTLTSQWMDNFSKSSLVKNDEGVLSINIGEAEKVLEEFNKWNPKNLPNLKEAMNWLSNFGINLSPQTVKQLINDGYWGYDSDNKPEKIKFSFMFKKSANPNGIFGGLAYRLEGLVALAKANKSTDFVKDEGLNPLNNLKGIVQKIANIEKLHTSKIATISYRDGSKSVYGITAQKYGTQVVDELTEENSPLRAIKMNLPYNQNSLQLNLLTDLPEYRSKFKMDHLGINAIKWQNKKLYKDNDITSLSDADHELTKLGGFQDTNQGDFVDKFRIGTKTFNIPLRIATMFNLTMSDKTGMLPIEQAVLSIMGNRNLVTIDGRNIKVSDEVREFLFTQLIEPELKRIIAHHKQAFDAKVSPNVLLNQRGVNKGNQMFLIMPEANNIMKYDASGNNEQPVRLIEYIAEAVKSGLNYEGESYEDLLTYIKPHTDKLLDDKLQNLVDRKINNWLKVGLLSLDDEGKINSHTYMNDGYFNSSYTSEEGAIVAALDFELNSLVSNANIHMTLAGDISNYVEDKMFKKEAGNFIDGSPFRPVNNGVYVKVIKDVVGTNLVKRLAFLSAPGQSLADSTNDKYIQVFLKDRISQSEHSKYLIELYFGKDAITPEVNKLLTTVDTAENIGSKNAAMKKLADMFPTIADYFDIEASDAQEYTTAKEAIDVLFRQGRMTDELYKSLNDKLKKGEDFSSEEEKYLYLQPIKPVYTGVHYDNNDKNERIVYIKTSSFPLLPQMTRGKELDKLRVKLEKIQEKSGKNVRASYDTGNKVGGVMKAPTIWDSEGNFIDFNTDDIVNSLNNEGVVNPYNPALVLDRKYFRIQQDVPYKAAKRTEDVNSEGTQSRKVIFGDGVSKIQEKVFTINGKNVSGGELHENHEKIYNAFIENETTQLYNKWGADQEDGQGVNIVKAQKLLSESATEAGYNPNALKLTEGEDGRVQFTIPIWLLPNGDKYESMLNSIVSNKIIHVKMPGNSYVTGSEEGLRWSQTSDINEVTDHSDIVHTSKFNGVELQAASVRDGVFYPNQIMVSSRFRKADGTLIDLIKDGYTKSEGGRLMLDESKIDPELLKLFSFRVPTSGHVSLSTVEIVGFLPGINADLMLVPKNFTKQKGLDFDVDKENTYQYWHTMGADGKISMLKSNNIDNIKDPKLKSKLLQNKLIQIYNSVMSSTDDRIQKKVNRVLSMDFAKQQADLIQSLGAKEDNKYFSPLDSDYQKEQMKLGASGKLGIAIYSNAVTFNSLCQQSKDPVHILGYKGMLKHYIIGEFESDGEIGKVDISSDRSSADVLGERQNTATDNVKVQVMPRVGVNDETINVDSLLCLLNAGTSTFNIDGKEVTIDRSYFLLSQPIIKDYCEALKNSKSLTATYDPASEEKIIERIKQKYTSENDGDVSETGIDDLRRKLTGKELHKNIAGKVDNNIQKTALDLFLELKEDARGVSKIQSTVNIQSGGLGIGIFEMQEKYFSVAKLRGNGILSNATSLVGDYIFESDENKHFNDADYLRENGYKKFITEEGKTYYVKPTTSTGALLVNGTKAGYDLWSDFFPYRNSALNLVMNKLMFSLGGEESSEAKKIDLKYDIFKDIKSFLYTSNSLGLFTGNPREELERLMVGNESLANYLNRHTISNNPLTKVLKENALIRGFDYKTDKTNPTITRIEYHADEGEEEYKMLALLELMDKPTKLPDFKDDTEYNTRKLAKDLILYSYIPNGGLQEAIQFTKYIPVEYLKQKGFTTEAQKWQSVANNDINGLWGSMLGYNGEATGRFEKQYKQHNPGKLRKVDIKTDITNIKKEGNVISEFTTKEPSISEFLTISDPNSSQKSSIFQFDSGTYKRIDNLGTFGMSEYNINSSDVKSVIPQAKTKPGVGSPVTNNINSRSSIGRNNIYRLNKNDTKTTLTAIEEADLPYLSHLAKVLKPFIGNIPIKVAPMEKGNGIYTGSEIIISEKWLNEAPRNSDIAKTILHEVIHVLTVKELREYFNKDGSRKSDVELPLYLRKLERVFQESVKVLNKTGKLDEFIKNYQNSGVIEGIPRDKIYYAGSSIFEFAAVVLTDSNLQSELANTPYKGTGNSILQEIVITIKKIVKKLGLTFEDDSLTAHAIDSVFEVIDRKEIKETPTLTSMMKENNVSSLEKTQKEINKLQKEAKDIKEVEEKQNIKDDNNMGEEDRNRNTKFSFDPNVKGTDFDKLLEKYKVEKIC